MTNLGAEARWYCVSRHGLATLCTGEADAIREAANASQNYPLHGPYRATQMVDLAHVNDLLAALVELRDRIKGHPAYAELTVEEEIVEGGDTAELSYLARVADAALAA